jgi:hypothetical protein
LHPQRAESGAGVASLDDPLVQRVLGEVEARIGRMLERRLKEEVAASAARVGEAIALDAREQLAPILHELVRQAVADERSRC